MKRLRWLIGLILILAVFAAIWFLNIPSLLGWQSEYLKKAFFVLIFCGTFCLYRALKGPTPSDRVVAIDILGILIVGFCAILGIPTGRDWYIDIAIAWALQSFISILALAKYMEGKRFED
jgi:multicomponent Na+:H+ antiporter subunit F